MKRKLIISGIVIIYMFLTFIKFFIGIVYPMGSEAYLVFKEYPTIENVWNLGMDTEANREKHKGKWYFEEDYIVLEVGELEVLGSGLVPFLAKVWWISTVAFLIIFVVLIYRKIFNKCKNE